MTTPSPRKKIAIIGTGISGLGAASLLHPHHDITVYEKNDYVGGHSRTIDVKTRDGIIAVDTGFIVFNTRNYPLLTRLFEYTNVPIVKSDMSFGVTINQGWLEYGTRKLSHMFAQPSNVLRPSFWKMLCDITTFNRKALAYLKAPPSFSLQECLDELQMGQWFRQYYLLAMGGAIWSTPLSQMLAFPACTFIRFFKNHGLLSINDHPQWYTVRGGSREYINRITAPFKERIHRNRAAHQVWREENAVIVKDVNNRHEKYDEIIFACHADQALALISDVQTEERAILSGFRYQPNRALLHSDQSFMPKRKKAWASWIYLSDSKTDSNSQVCLSYWMNHLQPLDTQQPLILTLNPKREPSPETVHNDHTFEHPIFDTQAIMNQSKISSIQGNNHFWFCGAYQRYGFHEDGLNSAIEVAKRMGITPPW